MDDKNEILRLIHQKIDYSKAPADEEIEMLIANTMAEYCKDHYISIRDKIRLGKELYNTVRKLDLLQEFLEDEEITEIMINGPNSIFIEKAGRLYERSEHFDSKEKLEDVIQQIAAKCNRAVNEASPIVDARLEDGSRVNVVMAPIALNGPILTIRRFPKDPIGIPTLIKIGSLPEYAANFLRLLVVGGYNILISGGTGSGKTTFLNALSDFIPSTERIITIEDSAELQIRQIPNLVRMETRNANTEGSVPITIRDLIKTSLRMRPDRIIVGEVRGAEALDLLQAMNTGHDGSISTGHANSARDMLSRLETMVLMGMDLPLTAIRQQIASGIDIIVHLGRLRDKTRKVLEIVEILGMEEGEIKTKSIYKFEETSTEKDEKVEGKLEFKNELSYKEKLQQAGISHLLVYSN